MNLLNFFDYFRSESAEARARREAIRAYEERIAGMSHDEFVTETESVFALYLDEPDDIKDNGKQLSAHEKYARINAEREMRLQRELDGWESFIVRARLPDPMTSSWAFTQQFLTNAYEQSDFHWLDELSATGSPATRRRLSKWQAAYLFRKLHEIDTGLLEEYLIEEEPPFAFAYINRDDYRRLLRRELARRDARG